MIRLTVESRSTGTRCDSRGFFAMSDAGRHAVHVCESGLERRPLSVAVATVMRKVHDRRGVGRAARCAGSLCGITRCGLVIPNKRVETRQVARKGPSRQGFAGEAADRTRRDSAVATATVARHGTHDLRLLRLKRAPRRLVRRLLSLPMKRTSAMPITTNPWRFALLGIWLAASAQAQVIERVSVSSTGEAGNNISQSAALSSDGRFVAFTSVAFNLVAQDNNGRRDIFVHDRQTDQTERISITAAGVQSNADAFGARISGDGNSVSFHSEASNLVAGGGDTNGVSDVFLKNRSTGALERISLGVGGVEGNSFSSNLGLSADAQWATLRSGADNLVAGDNNDFDDIFLVELATGSVERINVATDGTEANNFSFGGIVANDAQEILFSSLATTMVAGDTNNRIDVFVRDRSVPETRRVVFAPGGGQLNDQARLSDATPDGRFVLFVSNAIVFDPSDTNGGFDLFVLDRDSGMVEAVSVATSGSFGNFATSAGRISATGRYVVFSSDASNLVTGDTNGRTDIFLRDRFRAETVRLSVSAEGVQGDFNSTAPAISADGRFVAFQSLSTTLVPNDDESETDVFV